MGHFIRQESVRPNLENAYKLDIVVIIFKDRTEDGPYDISLNWVKERQIDRKKIVSEIDKLTDRLTEEDGGTDIHAYKDVQTNKE